MHLFNTTVFASINQVAGRSEALDTIMLWATHYVPYLMVLVIVVYMLFVYPRVWGYSARHRLAQALEFVLTIATTFIAVQFIKVLVAYPRPFAVLAETILLVPDQSGYSFPSMHSALTIAVATSVFVHHRRLGTLLVVFALLVGFSRIYVGVHYPIDVVVGGGIGAIIALVFHKLFSKVANHTEHHSAVAEAIKKR